MLKMSCGRNGLPVLRLISGPTPRSAPFYSAHQDAAKRCDLPKMLGEEPRTQYQVPQELPDHIFALLMRLNDNGGSDTKQTPYDQNG
jgi:hypothetical protein